MARTTALISTLLILLVGAALSLPGGNTAAADAGPAEALGALTPHTATEAAIVVEALAHFDANGFGFESDPLVSFHRDMAECAGNLGFWTDEDGTDRVRVCWTNEDPAVEKILRTQALVHELAHAWVHRNTDAADREAFARSVGADSWNAADSDWDHRGTEIAAELITWALLDPAVLFVEFDESTPERWVAAFEQLTGAAAPAALTAA